MSLYERLQSVYNALRDGGRVHSQHDFAVLLEASDTTVSKALKQNEKYLTPNLVKRAEALLLQEPKEDELTGNSILVIPYEARGGTIGDFVQGIERDLHTMERDLCAGHPGRSGHQAGTKDR